MSKKTQSSKQHSEVALTERNPLTSLPIQKQRYAEARLQGLAPSAACRAAGILPTDMSKYERDPKIRQAIHWAVKETFEDVGDITKNDVLRGMKDAVEAAATAQDLISAWREIGKLIGAYEPERKILEVHDYTREELKSLSEEDLLKLAGGKMNDAIDGEFYELGGGEDEHEEETAIAKP